MSEPTLHDQLILLSAEKKIKHKKKFLQEASEEFLQGILKEYEAQQLEETNAQLSLVLTKKFSDLMLLWNLSKTSTKTT